MLGQRLKKLRQAKNHTQQQIADLLKINRVTYTQYELDKREPDNAILSLLADFFGVSTDYLLGRTDDAQAHKITTMAAHRADDPTSELPEDARKSIEDFKKFIFEKHGVKYD
jgi:transcriptional regulator with XRE-family HTH domain